MRRVPLLLSLPLCCAIACSRTPADLDLSARLAAGQARAGVIRRPEELIGGPVAKGRVGDVKIYNSRVAFVIAGAGGADGYAPYGGKILDADRVRAPGEAGRSRFGEWIFGFDQRLCAAERVTVLRDGVGGGPAVVRVEGRDAAIPLIDVVLEGIIPSRDRHSWITIDYVLEPDADRLRVEVTIENRGEAVEEFQMRQIAFLMGDGAQPWQPGPGFETTYGPASFYAAVADDVSYGFFEEAGPIYFLSSYSSLLLASQGGFAVPPREKRTFRMWLVVGEGDTVSIDRAWRAAVGRVGETVSVRGRVVDATGSPVAGARVHAIQTLDGAPRAHAGVARTGADGTYVLDLPVGSYELRSTAEEYPPSEPAHLAVNTVSGVSGPLPGPTLRTVPSGVVQYSVTDASGRPLPAKIAFHSISASTALPKMYGTRRFGGGASRIVFAYTGRGEIRLPAGRYRVSASRGFEYTAEEREIDLGAGGTLSASFALDRIVDTTGYLSGDFHLHAQKSPDSDDLDDYKVAAFAAEGLEVPVSTDHEYVSDYAPTIARMGLERWVRSIVGEEVTTFTLGHFNAFPLAVQPSKRNMGFIEWYGKTGGEIFAAIRANPAEPVIQINHPRSSGAGGYFSAVGYEPSTGTVEKPEQWSEDFDVIEVVNGNDGSNPMGSVFLDWYGFLNRGKRVTATGNSDSHFADTSVVGLPRNYVRVPSDDLGAFDARAFVESVRAGRVIVSGGAFVTAAVAGQGPGEQVSVAGGAIALDVVVQAAPWVDLNRLVVIANGREVHARDLTAADADPSNPVVRFRGTIALGAERDTWYVVHVRGARGMPFVAPGARPWAFTNPIYVDVDGNGRFDAPDAGN